MDFDIAAGGQVKTYQVNNSTKDGLQTNYHFEVFDENGSLVEKKSFTDQAEADSYFLQKIDEGLEFDGVPPSQAKSPVGAGPPASSPQPTEVDPAAPGGTASQSVAELQADKAGKAPDIPGVSLEDLMAMPPIELEALLKKARDLQGLPPDIRKKIEKAPLEERAHKGILGVFGEKKIQPRINRVSVPSELEIRGPDNNCFIVLGNDRVNHFHTGYGGKGHTQCDSIDLVAGAGGHNPQQVDATGEKSYTNPNFALDAARIIISQKTDIDRNFSIGAEESYFRTDAKSGIAIKADNVRLVGRESLKLVTNTDRKNSQGGTVRQFSGIHLMANNDEDGLQPLVLGDNLSEALFKIVDYIEDLAQYFHAWTKYQRKFNNAVANHKHITTFFAHPTLPSGETMISDLLCNIETTTKTDFSVLKQITNLTNFKKNYLMELGSTYINSRFNKGN